MSTPTISAVTPTAGPTRGRRLCKIVGTNFSLQPTPQAQGRTSGTIKPSVQVLFGTDEAAEVHVLSPTLLHVITPPHDAGTFSITVRNVDQDGVLIGSESVTKPNAYTFERADFNRLGANESILVRVTRTLMRELKRQLLGNVVLTVHTDFDDDTGDGANVAMLASVPGVVMAGPTMRENKMLRTSEDREETVASQTYHKRPARTVDLVFAIIGVHDVMQPTLNFMQETVGFFEGNKHLRVLQDPTVPNEYVEFEMQIDEDFKVLEQTDAQAQKNIHSFQGTISVLGIDLDDDDMASRALFDILDVTPTGSVMPSQGVIFTGEPGTTPASPVPANPPAQVGNTGPFEQFIPEED